MADERATSAASHELYLEHQMKQHVEPRLSRVFAHNVGGREVKERRFELGAHTVQEHVLARAVGSHQEQGLDVRAVLA